MNEKQTGSFYTPKSLVEYMVEYARGKINPASILEPSAGDGRFAVPLKSFSCPISLVEVEQHKASDLRKAYSDFCCIVEADFLEFSLQENQTYDLIIGNPPYIRKKTLPQKQRDLSQKLLEHFNLSHDLFQNIWVSFILGALKCLSSSGAIFFVLPFEFLQVQYAEKLREFLERRFNTIEIITFEDSVFSEIEQDICLVYLSNESKGNPYIKYTTLVSDTNTEVTFESVIQRNKPLRKWSNCILNDTETEILLKTAACFRKVKTFGEVSPGIVTGANSFFVVTSEKARELNISRELTLPILTKSSHIPALLLLKNTDFDAIETSSRRTRLLNLSTEPKDNFSEELEAYIHMGVRMEINARYKCRERKRWFDVPIVKRGDACFFKRFHKLPKLLVNDAQVYTTDISYNIRFNSETKAETFAFCFYNSLTLALCEYCGRFYGGGVCELVPSEFKDIAVPYREIPVDKIAYLDTMFREEAPYDEIIDYVDSYVLSELPQEVLLLLQGIRNRYLTRRMKLYDRKEGTHGE